MQGISQTQRQSSSPTFTIYNDYSLDNNSSDTNVSDLSVRIQHRGSSSQNRTHSRSRSRSRSRTSNPPDRDASPTTNLTISSTLDTSDVNETFLKDQTSCLSNIDSTNSEISRTVSACENIGKNLVDNVGMLVDKPAYSEGNWPKLIMCPSCTYENLFTDPKITELVCQLCFCPFDE